MHDTRARNHGAGLCVIGFWTTNLSANDSWVVNTRSLCDALSTDAWFLGVNGLIAMMTSENNSTSQYPSILPLLY